MVVPVPYIYSCVGLNQAAKARKPKCIVYVVRRSLSLEGPLEPLEGVLACASDRVQHDRDLSRFYTGL